MKRNISLRLVCTAIFLSLMSVAASADETELPGLDVYVIGQHAYVAGGSSGLYVVDVRRPVNPQWVASVDTTGEAKGVYTISGFAYVADGPAGLQLVNNRELRSLRIVVSYNTLGETRNVYGLASTVYVAGSGFGLGVFEVIARSRLNPNGHFLVNPDR